MKAYIPLINTHPVAHIQAPLFVYALLYSGYILVIGKFKTQKPVCESQRADHPKSDRKEKFKKWRPETTSKTGRILKSHMSKNKNLNQK